MQFWNYVLQLDPYFQYDNSQGEFNLLLLPTTKGQWAFYWLLCLVETPLWWDWSSSLFNSKKVFLISLFWGFFLSAITSLQNASMVFIFKCVFRFIHIFELLTAISLTTGSIYDNTLTNCVKEKKREWFMSWL